MLEKLESRKFINAQVVNIILALIIFYVPELRTQAMYALLVNNGIYSYANVKESIGKK